MAKKDLEDIQGNIEEGIENLKNKSFEVFGIKMTPMTIGAAVTAIGSVVGMLYAGFVMYQKIEEVANLDIEAFNQRMEVMEAKMEETTDYTRDIKNGLRDDIVRLERIVDKVEDDINGVEDDVRTTIDDAEERFEVKRQDLLNQYVAQKDLLIRENTATRDILETKIQNLEADMEKQLQRALDNPLANR